MSNPVAYLIKNRRSELTLTQMAVAKKVKVSVRTVQRWEAGESRPQNAHLLRLARLLGLDPTDFA